MVDSVGEKEGALNIRAQTSLTDLDLVRFLLTGGLTLSKKCAQCMRHFSEISNSLKKKKKELNMSGWGSNAKVQMSVDLAATKTTVQSQKI